MTIEEFEKLIKNVMDLPYQIEQDSRSSYSAFADNGEMQINWGYDIGSTPHFSFECLRVVNGVKLFQVGKGDSPLEAFTKKREFIR